jgi:hypothetical protein
MKMRAALVRNILSNVSRGALRPALASTTTRSTIAAARTFSANAGSVLRLLTKENPHVDVVRYEHKNRKWSLSHVDYYSEALAIGFIENGLQPGDVLLSYLPLHFSESVSSHKLLLLLIPNRDQEVLA